MYALWQLHLCGFLSRSLNRLACLLKKILNVFLSTRYLRLELLEGVVAYHSGHFEQSQKSLTSAQAKYLQVRGCFLFNTTWWKNLPLIHPIYGRYGLGFCLWSCPGLTLCPNINRLGSSLLLWEIFDELDIYIVDNHVSMV